MARIFILLLLLAAGADAGVSTPVSIAHTTEGNALLGIPRYKAGGQGDTLICMFGSHGSGDHIWSVSHDRGDTWTAVSGIPYMSDHSAGWFDGGFHVVYRKTGAAAYRYVGPPYTQFSNMGPVREPSSAYDTYYPIVVANGVDDVWFFDMTEGSGRSNLRYWHSTDRFESNVTSGFVCSISADPQNEWRMGAVIGDNGYPVVSVYDFDLGFAVWSYNGSGWDSTHVTSDRNGALGRQYCHVEMNGRTHIAWGDDGVLSHHYEGAGGTFTRTTIATYSDLTVLPQFCVHGEGSSARLYAAYCGSGGVIYTKSWTPSDGWDADPVTVSGAGHSGTDPQMCPYIPSSWDFIPIWYQNGASDIYFVKLDAESQSEPDTIPPAAIMDLGATTGTLNGTVNLDWTAPGNDEGIGTAASYEIRYSTAPIDETTWHLGTAYDSPPAPLSAGSNQILTVSDLIPETFYYVAIRTHDSHGNESGLSNIASAEAYLDLNLDVDEEESQLPAAFRFSQNYPNPFNPSTVIEYSIPQPAHVNISIYNVKGQETCNLVNEPKSPGDYAITWVGMDCEDNPVASGVYFFKIRAGDYAGSKKMILLK